MHFSINDPVILGHPETCRGVNEHTRTRAEHTKHHQRRNHRGPERNGIEPQWSFIQNALGRP
eukprot:3161368-Alexandrium_andersonii.AAC.1